MADLYLGNPAFEDALEGELTAARKKTERLTAGVIATPPGALVDPCFARQVLPRARFVDAAGPSALADAALSALDDESAHALYEGRATLFVTAPDFHRKGSGPPAPHPLAGVAEAVRDVLEKKIEGRARKRGIERSEGEQDTLVQVLVTGSFEGYVSAAPLDARAPRVAAWPARFPAGRATLGPQQDAPSSAYRKLEEALLWLDAAPRTGDVALDLGAAPGGWTWVALAHGAKVIAFDRAKLDPRLEDHPRVEHLRKDAFTEAPLDQASWLLCDVIDVPTKSLELIRRALAEPKLNGLVVTVKLKRPVDVNALEAARALVRETPGFVGRAKNLVHNKCEITVMMRRP